MTKSLPQNDNTDARRKIPGVLLRSMITFVTGSSLNADVEKTLVIGAHGPEKLAIFVSINDSLQKNLTIMETGWKEVFLTTLEHRAIIAKTSWKLRASAQLS